jgi:oligoribonuclease
VRRRFRREDDQHQINVGGDGPQSTLRVGSLHRVAALEDYIDDPRLGRGAPEHGITGNGGIEMGAQMAKGALSRCTLYQRLLSIACNHGADLVVGLTRGRRLISAPMGLHTAGLLLSESAFVHRVSVFDLSHFDPRASGPRCNAWNHIIPGVTEMAMDDLNLIWVDMEMTGLVPEQHRVIEIATIVTDSHLHILAEGPVIAIRQADECLEAMDEWNTRTHTQSGLVERVKASAIDEHQASEMTLAFLAQWVGQGKSPMCGNSICQDRRFMAQHMPELESYFHYRNLDVSTLKILMQRWRPDLPEAPKQGAHQALADIRESIEELRHYREHFLRMA